MLGHLRCRIIFSSERIQRVVALGGITHKRNFDGNLVVRYLNWNGEWDWNYNWLDNDFNDNNPAVLLASLFLSLASFICRESFSLRVVHSILPAFYQFHSIFQKVECISCCLMILSPKESLRKSSECLLF
jgi:hypothetical protein